MDRLPAWAVLACLALGSVPSSSCAGVDAGALPRRPNIVFLLADDMRWDAMGCAGDRLLRTTHLDRLAAAGTRFRNAFVTTSVCAVSRASILTGQYARRHGSEDFSTPIRPELMYPVILRKQGYYTGFIGKFGVNFDDRDYFRQCALQFDYWACDLSQTRFWHDRDCSYVTNNGTTERADCYCNCPVNDPTGKGLKNPVHLEAYVIPQKVRSFLDQREPGKPFCLSVSMKAPHGPWEGYAPEFAQRFEGTAMPCAASVTLEDAATRPDFLRRSLANPQGWEYVQRPTPGSTMQDVYRKYYRLIESLDQCVGLIVQELRQRKLADNTVVIFFSDNGHFFGEHGFFGKWLQYEESIRVPLIIMDPRLPADCRGQTCDELALNIDVAPTILDLAGVPVPPAMQGLSLTPLLRDPQHALRESFFLEHVYLADPKDPRHIEPSEAVRTRDWKYICYFQQQGPAREELYNLNADPLEMRNLSREPGSVSRLDALRVQCEQYRRELK